MNLIQKSKKLNFKKRLTKFQKKTGKIPMFVRMKTGNKVMSKYRPKKWRSQKLRV